MKKGWLSWVAASLLISGAAQATPLTTDEEAKLKAVADPAPQPRAALRT